MINTDKERDVLNKFLTWFETLSQEEAEIFMTILGAVVLSNARSE